MRIPSRRSRVIDKSGTACFYWLCSCRNLGSVQEGVWPGPEFPVNLRLVCISRSSGRQLCWITVAVLLSAAGRGVPEGSQLKISELVLAWNESHT